MRTHCTDQRDLEADGARSGPRGAAVVSRRALWARVRRSWCRSWLGTLQSRAVVRSECEAAWHRLCGGPDQGDLGSLAGRAHHPADPAVLTPASGSPVSKGVASCVQHPWTRSRSLRGLPRMAGGHRAFYRAGYTGHLHLRTRPDLRRSRRGLVYRVWGRRVPVAGSRRVMQ